MNFVYLWSILWDFLGDFTLLSKGPAKREEVQGKVGYLLD